MEREWALYLGAMRWRRAVEWALEGSGLTFRGWLVLMALVEVLRKTEDAVSQNQVAAYLELPRNAVSEVMHVLQDKGLVDRDCSASGTALRIYVTFKAEVLLRRCVERLAEKTGIDAGIARSIRSPLGGRREERALMRERESERGQGQGQGQGGEEIDHDHDHDQEGERQAIDTSGR